MQFVKFIRAVNLVHFTIKMPYFNAIASKKPFLVFLLIHRLY